MFSKYKLAKLKLKFLKLKFSSYGVKAAIVLVVSTTTMAGFQNCAKTKFTAVEQASKVIQTSAPTCIHPFTGEILREGQGFTAWQRALIPIGDKDVCRNETRTCVGGEITGTYVNPNCVKLTPGNCILEGMRNGVPETVSILHGQSVNVYETSSVGFGSSCDGVKHRRTCDNGVLSAPNFIQLACTPEAAANCPVVLRKNGVNQSEIVIKHGKSISNLFANYSLPAGSSCGSGETLSCNNGQLSGTNNRDILCIVQPPPPKNCTNVVLRKDGVNQPAMTINHGQSVPNLFAQFSVPSGSSCGTGQTLTCSDGVLSGTNNREIQCAPLPPPKNCTNVVLRKDGVNQPAITINHGQSVQNLFAQFSVPNGSSCGAGQTLTCNNGQLSGTNNREIQCAPQPPANCENVVLRKNGVNEPAITIKHGQTVPNLYAQFSVAFPSTCGSGQGLTCTNGQLSGTNNREILCTDGPPKNCTNVVLRKDGVNQPAMTINHGQSVPNLFAQFSVPNGSSCGTGQTLTCSDGVLTGTNNREIQCAPLPPPKNCTNVVLRKDGVNQPAITINHGQSVQNLFAQFLVPVGASCGTGQILTCNDGQLSGTNNREIQCAPQTPANCENVVLKRNGVAEAPITINHGESVPNLFATFSVPYNATCSGQQLTCNNGVLSGTTNREVVCAPLPPPPRDCSNVILKQDGVPQAPITILHGQSRSGLFANFSVPFGTVGGCGNTETLTCNDGNLMGTSYREIRCNVQPASFTPIDVQGNSVTTAVPIKVFMIIDFSYSMSNELVKVKNALDAFLEANKTRQAFDVYLYPVLGHTDRTAGVDILRSPLAQMHLRNNSNYASEKQAFMNSVQAQINLAASNTNEVNEVGLCQMVRILKQSNLYASDDKVAFIVVTDENDGSFKSNGAYEGGCNERVVSGSYKNYLCKTEPTILLLSV